MSNRPPTQPRYPLYLCNEPVSPCPLRTRKTHLTVRNLGPRLGVPSSSTLSHRDRSSQYSNGTFSGTPYSSTPSGSGRASPLLPTSNGNGAYGAQRFAEDLEGQNDERLEGLTAKVKLLKDVSQLSLSSILVCCVKTCLSGRSPLVSAMRFETLPCSCPRW